MNLVAFAIMSVIVIIDQLIKKWVVFSIKPIASVSIIKGILNFTYVENYGAAYSLFQNKRWFLIILTSVLLIGIMYYIFSKKTTDKTVIICSSMIIGGGIGNLIDRVLMGYVVDFIDVTPLFNFPVFNFADCCVVVGVAIFIVYLMFFENKVNKKEIKW